MTLVIVNSPTVARIIGHDNDKDKIKALLTYNDKRIEFDIKRHNDGANWYLRNHSKEEWYEELDRLKSLRKKTVLFEDEEGLWTYSRIGWIY